MVIPDRFLFPLPLRKGTVIWNCIHVHGCIICLHLGMGFLMQSTVISIVVMIMCVSVCRFVKLAVPPPPPLLSYYTVACENNNLKLCSVHFSAIHNGKNSIWNLKEILLLHVAHQLSKYQCPSIHSFQVITGNSILSELTKAEMSKKVGHFGFKLTYKDTGGQFHIHVHVFAILNLFNLIRSWSGLYQRLITFITLVWPVTGLHRCPQRTISAYLWSCCYAIVCRHPISMYS